MDRARPALLLVALTGCALLSHVAAQSAGGPVAFFTVEPDVVRTGTAVKVDARESLPSPGARLVEFAWRWGNGTYEPADARAERAFSGAGTVVIGLRVRDDAGGVAYANQTVLVRGAAPSPYFTLVTETTGDGTLVRVDATYSEPSPGAQRIVRYEWRWGDSPDAPFVTGNVTEEHVFSRPGRYVVSLRVTDDEDRTATANEPVVVGSTLGHRLGLLWDERAAFLRGAGLTLRLAVMAIAIGFVAAIFIGLARVSRSRLIRAPATAYVEFIRGTPLLVQILIAWLVLPAIGIKLPILWAGLVALVVNTAAYQAEVIRAGIQGIPTGQMEAALALGMTYPKAMKNVVMPQAVRLILPPLGNEFIILLKDTSLVSVIGVIELTQVAQIFSARTFLVLETWLGVALIYFVMTYSLSQALRAVERRVRVPGLGLDQMTAAH